MMIKILQFYVDFHLREYLSETVIVTQIEESIHQLTEIIEVCKI